MSSSVSRLPYKSRDLLSIDYRDSGQLDSIGECTGGEDVMSLDKMSQQAFTIQKEWLSEFNPIGKGAFGEVFHTLLRYGPSANPIEVAVKTVKVRCVENVGC